MALKKADVSVSRGDNSLEICIIGAGCTDSWFMTYRVIIDAALRVLGFEETENEINMGIMKLVFEKAIYVDLEDTNRKYLSSTR